MTDTMETVKQIGEINFSGHIIPHSWYYYLRRESEKTSEDGETHTITGKPHLPAITILSDIVYWYRPRIVRDETTNEIVRIEKRFAADKLQRSYAQFAEIFGLGKEQARKAVKFLAKKGLITLEFRTLYIRGRPMHNVLFIEIVPEKVKQISQPIETQKNRQVCARKPIGSSRKPTSLCQDIDTNTETTTESTTETTEKKRLSRFSATDPLSLMVEIQDRRAASGEIAERPMGWQKTRQDVWEVCRHFAALFNRPIPAIKDGYNAVTRSKVEIQIDTWSGGAQLLLERCSDGRDGAFLAIDRWHRNEWSVGKTPMTVTSPMSLVNVVPAFAEDQAPSIIKVGH